MTDFDPAQIEAGLKALSSVDFAGAITAFETQNATGELQTAEQVADLISAFVPQAMYVKDALVAVQFLMEMQNAGYIRPADPSDPVMQRAAGHGGLGQDHT